jgi:CAI-1 autoinducer synthase
VAGHFIACPNPQNTSQWKIIMNTMEIANQHVAAKSSKFDAFLNLKDLNSTFKNETYHTKNLEISNQPFFKTRNTFHNPPLGARLQERIARDFTKRWEQQWGGKFILHGLAQGADAIRLDGNDYLNISGHPEIVQAQIDSLKISQQSVVQSGVFHLDHNPSRLLGMKLANWIGKEDGIICQSGFAANVGLLQIIADEKTPVYLDALAHASLREGAHTARAPTFTFRHNDLTHLSRLIGQHGPGLVVVDSIYSTTGAVCPLTEMADIVEANDCMFLVDESHSLGTHGPNGAGFCSALGISDRVHFITASLAKAFSGRAGFFSIPSAMRHYMLITNNANIFSSSLLPYEIAGLEATLKVIQQSEAERTRLHECTHRIRSNLSEMGYPIHQGTEQIIALEAGLEPNTMFLRDCLEERNIFGAIFCAPATSRNRAMVRFTINSGLTPSALDSIEAAAKEISFIVKPWDWPIAKRSRATRISGSFC